MYYLLFARLGPPQFRGPDNVRGGVDLSSRDRFPPRRDRSVSAVVFELFGVDASHKVVF